MQTWDGIIASVTSAVPDAQIRGVVVAPTAPQGIEVLVGARRDSIFGPIVAFGAGGFLVEAVRDASVRASPLIDLEAQELIDETAASRMLDGYRNLPAVDRKRWRASWR